MTITNQFVTAGDFWSGMVEPDYEEHLRDFASLRAALHVAISLFHMSDWVFHTHEAKVRAAFPISPAIRYPESDFADALELRNQDFGRLRVHLPWGQASKAYEHQTSPERTQPFLERKSSINRVWRRQLWLGAIW